jgi:hypothetical protein
MAVAIAYPVASKLLYSAGMRIARRLGVHLYPCFSTAPQKQRRLDPRMASKQARQFETGIAGCAENRSFEFPAHRFFRESPD